MKHIEPTTTGAPAVAGENQYLARISELAELKQIAPAPARAVSPRKSDAAAALVKRFAEPATRVGEILQIDDAAAGIMWAASIARNPELTPREFVIIARAKLAEWRRESDARPGLKIRSLTGLLIRSMPNAVVGAPYYAARDEARHELARDRAAAEEILAAANAPARARAWALAVLAEPAGEET